jgi:hypothetical protein
MNRQELGNGWFAEIGQEYPVEAWAFSVYHDIESDSSYENSWWSDSVRVPGFIARDQAAEALELFLQHEVLLHCEVHARGWDEQHKVVELVQVFYRFATSRWSYRLAYEPDGVSGWRGYYCGDYASAADAIRAGQGHWEQLRMLGTGGTEVDPHFKEGEDYFGRTGRGEPGQ